MRSSPSSRPDGARCGVLHFVSTFEIKTDTKWLVQIARHLDRETFSLSAACFYGGGPIRDRLESLGVRTYDLDVQSERDPRAILRARRIIEESGSEIVHTHLLRADLLGGLAARWAGTPAVVSTVYAMGQYARSHRRRSDRLLDAAYARLPTHFVAVSRAVERDCVDRLHIDPERITVLHTGIDPPEKVDGAEAQRLRSEWVSEPGGKLVVAVARLSYEKGIDTLIDAAAALHKTHPHVRVVVVGEGPDRGDLESRIHDRGLGGVVWLVGFRADVWPALAAADVVCMPSRSEGMPNALLESMVLGCPVVATEVGGISEVIASGENGLLVGAGDVAALAGAIARLVEDRRLAESLGPAGKRTIEERFLARDVVARYGAFYEGVLGQRRRARASVMPTG